MTREIVVNGRFLSRRVTGVERYGHEILELIRERCRLEETRVNGLRGQVWEQFILPRKLNRLSMLWSPANTGPLIIRNQALTIHDLSPLEHPEWFRKDFAAWYRLFLPILARHVRVIFSPSEHVQRRVRARFGHANVVMTPNGVDQRRFHPAARQYQHAMPSQYILFVGTLEPRKNLNALVQAWNELKKSFRDVWLIIAGAHGKVFKPITFPEDMERVRFLGYVDDHDLPGLYANASLFVLPSFDEGFGLPALEAMACGAPVLVSNGGALCEVVGDAACVFDLSEPHSLRNTMRECLEDTSLRAALSEKGLKRAGKFSWHSTADTIWKTLNEI